MRSGQSKTSLRKLSARNRFRAAQALKFIPTCMLDTSNTSTLSKLTINCYCNFLYCLSELQEIRLTTSEESLLESMSFNFLDSLLLVSSKKDSIHFRSLVLTWIHDEGNQVDVVELARDLFVLTNSSDVEVLHKIIQQMLTANFGRTLYSTLDSIYQLSVQHYQYLLHSTLSRDILNSLGSLLICTSERLMQVIVLFCV
jgi:hypothetical protein